jgi:hypothetical protein
MVTKPPEKAENEERPSVDVENSDDGDEEPQDTTGYLFDMLLSEN